STSARDPSTGSCSTSPAANGIARPALTIARFRVFAHQCGAQRGSSAIAARRPANGRTLQSGSTVIRAGAKSPHRRECVWPNQPSEPVENGRASVVSWSLRMESSPRRPLVSCSPWALVVLLLLAAAYVGSRLAGPLLSRTHDPDAVPRPIAAR